VHVRSGKPIGIATPNEVIKLADNSAFIEEIGDFDSAFRRCLWTVFVSDAFGQFCGSCFISVSRVGCAHDLAVADDSVFTFQNLHSQPVRSS
jgi:hypothetical protein